MRSAPKWLVINMRPSGVNASAVGPGTWVTRESSKLDGTAARDGDELNGTFAKAARRTATNAAAADDPKRGRRAREVTPTWRLARAAMRCEHREASCCPRMTLCCQNSHSAAKVAITRRATVGST